MELNNKYDGLIYDLDGTLWETIDCCMKANEYMINKYSDITKPITRDTVIASMGKPLDEIADMYYGYLPKETAIKYNNEFFKKVTEYLLQDGGLLYKNMKETILELSKNYKLYIVSNCIEGYIEAFLYNTNLWNFFEDYECNGRTGLSKAENIKLIIERNKINKPIYIGDTQGDKDASVAADIPFIYAAYGFGNVEEYDYKIDDISELLKILK